jgi:hypothetical protein
MAIFFIDLAIFPKRAFFENVVIFHASNFKVGEV